jgi:cytochrome c oxidase cbb3-type subunit 3
MNLTSKRALLAASLPAVAFMLLIPGIAAQNPGGPGQNARPRSTVGSQGPLPEHASFTSSQVENGGTLFLQNCAFCHGKDASGGESGPALTSSKLVTSDKAGETLGEVIRNGRPEKGMPRFTLPDPEILNLVAFIHKQQDNYLSQSGNRRGVDESDLHTGSAEAGKKYFEGAGGCVKCHSATGDLAGVATRFTGLGLEQQMLYPRNVKSKITVKTRSGESFSGTLSYQDEFTIGLTDAAGTYHSWPVSAVTFNVDRPVDAHVDAMAKYTDDDIHNVLAYIQTLK